MFQTNKSFPISREGSVDKSFQSFITAVPVFAGRSPTPFPGPNVFADYLYLDYFTFFLNDSLIRKDYSHYAADDDGGEFPPRTLRKGTSIGAPVNELSDSPPPILRRNSSVESTESPPPLLRRATPSGSSVHEGAASPPPVVRKISSSESLPPVVRSFGRLDDKDRLPNRPPPRSPFDGMLHPALTFGSFVPVIVFLVSLPSRLTMTEGNCESLL